MAKKNSFFGTLAMVLALVFGLVLAGCPTEDNGGDDGGGDPPPNVPSGTIKLTETSVNNFTLTLTGGLKWKEGTDQSISMLLVLDGDVSAPEGAEGMHWSSSLLSGKILNIVIPYTIRNYDAPFSGKNERKFKGLREIALT